MRRRLLKWLKLILLALSAFTVGVYVTRALLVTHADTIAPGLLFSADAPLPVPSLQVLAEHAQNDADALTAVARYFDANEALLAGVFAEHNDTRLRALFAMYAVHVSHVYGTPERAATGWLDWLSLPIADCGAISEYQAQLLSTLGVEWRTIQISGATHQFDEALVNGHYEVFDATVNVWIDTESFQLERGAARTIRLLYTPALDARMADRYTRGMLRGAQELRASLPLLGVGWYPKAYLFISAASNED